MAPTGVVFFQLGNSTLPAWLVRLDTVLADLAAGRFLVVTPHDITIRTH